MNYKRLVLLLLIGIVQCFGEDAPKVKPRSVSDEQYDDKIPILHEGEPVRISVSLDLEAMDVINYVEQEMTLFVDLYEQWNDFRLNRTKSPNDPVTEGLVHEGSKFWSPDSYFLQSKSTDVNKITTKIRSDGTVRQMAKLRLTVHCSMNFFYFPFDKQHCSLKLTNSEHSTKELVYVWDPKGVNIEKEITSTQLYELGGYTLTNFTSKDDNSGLEMILYFSRKTERGFPMFYFPAVAIATIAFISLWIKDKLIAIYISIASFLAMVVFVMLVVPEIPIAHRMGMLDHYYFLSLNVIFNALLMNIIMYSFRLPPKNYQPKPQNPVNDCNDLLNGHVELKSVGDGTSSNASDKTLDSSISDDPEERIRKLGKFKQFIYFNTCKKAKYHGPIGFAVINVIYWMWILIALLLEPKGEHRI